MIKKFNYSGIFILVCLAFSFSLMDQKPIQKMSDLPIQEKGNSYIIHSDKIFNSSLSKTNTAASYTFQDFESKDFPPAGWTIESTGIVYWSRFLVSAYGVGTASALFDFFDASAGTTQSLVTSILPASVSGDSLKFDNAYATYQSEVDQLIIETSANGGSSYTTLVTLNGGVSGPLVTAPPTTSLFIPTASQWATKRYALPAGINRIRFRCVSAFGNNLYLDNIFIGAPFSTDVGTYSLNFPAYITPAPLIPQAAVKNFGTAAQTFPVTMTISPGGYSSTQTVTSLAPGATQNVNFASWTPALGAANVTCYTQLAGDMDRSNDTLQTILNVTTSYWNTGSSLPEATDLGTGVGYSRNDTGWIFILGGEQSSNAVQRYNIRTNSWTTMAPTPLGKDRQGSAILKDSIYSIGGVTGNPAFTTDVYKYDIKTNTWESRAPLPGALGWCKGAGYQDSLIYVAGGYDGSSALAQVILYNANTNNWRTATPLPEPRYGGGFAVKGDTLVYVSGVDGAAIVSTVYRGVISQTDRSVISWTSGAPMPGALSSGMFRFDAHAWGNNGIIITGGSSFLPFTSVSNACLIYSPGANVWTTMPNKITPWTAGQSGVAKSNNCYRLVCAGGFNGNSSMTENEIFSDSSLVVGISNQGWSNLIANDYRLSQNYPNPFNPVTKINFSIPKQSVVTLRIFDLLGKEVTTLINESKSAGNYDVSFDGANLSSGVYFYKIEAGDFSDVKRMMLIK